MSQSRKRFTTFALDNGWNVEFPTEPAGVLCLGPGKIHIAARFLERYRAEEGWYTVIDCELRLADSDGKLWQAAASFLSNWLLYPLIDLSRKEPARWLRNAPPSWREALAKRSLLKDIPSTYDDRFYRYVWIDNTGFSLQFKYLPAGFEIASLTADQLVVRVADLFCCWNPLPVAGPDGAPDPLPLERRVLSDEEREEEEERFQQTGESGDHEHISPLGYEIAAGRVLFRNTAYQPEDEPGWNDSPVDRPLIFRQVRGKGPVQPAVVFRPGPLSAPLALPEQTDAGGFVEMTYEHWYPLELLTNEAGLLVLECKKLKAKVRLERHPNSDREPVDVLRCRVRIADDSGDLWESMTLFTPDFFLEKLVDLDRIDMVSQLEPEESPWQPGPGALLGVRALIDDRAWRYLLLEDELLAFQGNRQKPSVDVRPTEEGFSVRLSGLVGRRRPIEIDHESRYLVLDPESRPASAELWEQDQPLPPLLFSVSFPELVFSNTTFAINEGFWHQNSIPIPVVFSRVGKGEPQEGVRFRARPGGDPEH